MKQLAGVAVLVAAFGSGVADAAPIPPGIGQQMVRLGGLDMQVLTYRPNCPTPALLLAFHGAKRQADTTLKAAKPLGDRLCLLVVVPEFDRETFPSSSYQRGGIATKQGVADPSQWTGNIVPELVAWVRQQEGREMSYYLIGHSAGGQFLSRVAAFVPTQAQRIVISNPSTYVLPSLRTKAPYGMGGVFAPRPAETALRRYLEQPISIFLGQEDVGDKMLAKGRRAQAQGETRYARGINAFAAGEQMAKSQGWRFGWRLVIVPGVGHNAGKMFSSPQAIEALKP